MSQEHTDHHDHSVSKWPLWLAGGTAAFILSPYLLPAIGIGTSQIAAGSMMQLHAVEPLGTGLAGGINSILNEVPLIGTHLVSGGWLNVLASATIGIGGVMLANWLEKNENKNDKIKWSSIIRYASLATSIFIALPSILTSISVAAVFFANLPTDITLANSLSLKTADFFASTLGSMGSMEIAAATSNLLSVTFTHLLTCGAAIIPPALALFMSSKSKQHTHHEVASYTEQHGHHSSWKERLEKTEKPHVHAALAR